MKSHARAAAHTILLHRRVQDSDCWKQTKTAFKCAPGSGWLFVLVALTEIFTNTLIILFDVVPDRTLVYMVLVIAVPPRIIVFIWASWKLSHKNWWRYWVTIDNILMLTVVIAIVYGYMLLKVPIGGINASGALEWRIAAVVGLPLLMSAFNGNFRILVKMYPWTPLTIMVYKCLRVYAVVLGTVSQLQLRGKNVPGMDPGLLILYVSSLASYHVSLLSRIPSWTAWQRSLEAKAKAAQAAGVPLVLDDVNTPKNINATTILAQSSPPSHAHHDHHGQYPFSTNSTVNLSLDSSDESVLPIDLSTLNALQPSPDDIESADERTENGYLSV